MTENSSPSTQLRVSDGYARLTVEARSRSWEVSIDHAVGGPVGWNWTVRSLTDDDVLLAGSEPTWAAALRKAFRAAERAGGEGK